MKYCPHCAGLVEARIPEGDHLPRQVCTVCGTVHYENPKLIAGCVPEFEGQILLCRRAIEPRLGFWTLPAGFMENYETLQQAAARECQEEALATVEVGSLLAVMHVLHAHQVHVMFRARLPSLSFGVGPESLEVQMVDEADIPWAELAFPSIEFSLRHYLEDRRRQVEDLHYATIDRRTRRH